MAIQVYWDDEKHTIIRWDFGDTWTWDDFRNAFKLSLEMGEGVAYRLDVLANATESPHMPMGALSEFKRLHQHLPDTVCLIVVAGTSIFTRTMIEMFGKVYRATSWRTVVSLADAYTLIQTDRLSEQDVSR